MIRSTSSRSLCFSSKYLDRSGKWEHSRNNKKKSSWNQSKEAAVLEVHQITDFSGKRKTRTRHNWKTRNHTRHGSGLFVVQLINNARGREKNRKSTVVSHDSRVSWIRVCVASLAKLTWKAIVGGRDVEEDTERLKDKNLSIEREIRWSLKFFLRLPFDFSIQFERERSIICISFPAGVLKKSQLPYLSIWLSNCWESICVSPWLFVVWRRLSFSALDCWYLRLFVVTVRASSSISLNIFLINFLASKQCHCLGF